MIERSPPASGSPPAPAAGASRTGRRAGASAPIVSATWPKRAIQASRSEDPLSEWTIATGLPSGVTTMSISSWTRARLLSSTIIANTEVPAETFAERGRTALVATMPVPASPSGGHSGMPAGSLPLGSISFAPSAVSRPAGRPAGRTLGEDVAELPAQLSRCDEGVEPRHPRRVPVTGLRVDREHARGLAHPHPVLAGQPPVDVAGQRGEVSDPRHVRLLLEDRLVEVGDAPALRHGEVEERGQLGAGVAGDVVPPGPERHEQLPIGVEGHVPVHHRADAHGRDGRQPHAVARAHVLDQRGVAVGQAASRRPPCRTSRCRP